MKAEKICQIIIFAGFAASAGCFLAGAASWIAASRCLVPEAGGRFWYNPMNGPLKVGNFTPEGLRWRRRSLRFLVAWIVTALGTVVGGGILLVACGVDLAL